MALIRGDASRLLLADEVGLGKTIQAALIVAELQQRRWCDHALILTPSGLRRQWIDELLQRFDIRAAVIDATSLSTLASVVPFDVNPWSIEPVVITSIDFIKQPEVLHAATAQVWDVLAVDEAHQASLGSLRHDAVKALANRARHVVLLSATPHAGDNAAFGALCALGEIDAHDPILVFRRTKEQVGLPRTRRVHLLPVSPTRSGVEMHRLLNDYVTRLWQIANDTGKRDLQLVAVVLAKRAFSSACCLAASLERRLIGLGEEIPVQQGRLPFADANTDDEALVPTAAAFDRLDEEREMLRTLAESAHKAQTDESKMRALKRLLRRIREPVIVFTEYRDALEAIGRAVGCFRRIVFLHGGQTTQERREAITTFASGNADLLLATDAGAEGLNLQSNCRVVINLELPWNPMRLEQRIGRVDRIGQKRTVHAINLFAAGTAESTVLVKLLQRLDRIRLSEIEIAAHVIGGCEPPVRPVSEEVAAHVPGLDAAARAEAVRISTTRASSLSRSTLKHGVVGVTMVRRFHAPPSLIVLCRVRLVNGTGRLVEDTLIPIRVLLRTLAPANKPRDVEALAEECIRRYGPALLRLATSCAESRAKAIESESATANARLLKREGQITCSADGVPLIQEGLFDNRASIKQRETQRQHTTLQRASRQHLNLLQAGTSMFLAGQPEVELAVCIC